MRRRRWQWFKFDQCYRRGDQRINHADDRHNEFHGIDQWQYHGIDYWINHQFDCRSA